MFHVVFGGFGAPNYGYALNELGVDKRLKRLLACLLHLKRLILLGNRCSIGTVVLEVPL